MITSSARFLIVLAALLFVALGVSARANQIADAPTVAQLEAPAADVTTEVPVAQGEEITMPLPSSLAIALIGLALLMLNHVRKRWHHLGA